MDLPSSQDFFARFVAAARRHNAEITALDHGVYTAKLGSGPRLAVLTGLHGDEPSGPLAVLRWFEETAPGALMPEGQELWVAPMVNTLGWDANIREWNGLDLNRSFDEALAPDFLKALMRDLADPLPTLYIDLHEDSDEPSYYFVYPHDTHQFSQRLAEANESGLVEWEDFAAWHGSSETFIREAGCLPAVTTEATALWTLEERTEWQLKSILWCRDHLLEFVAVDGK